MIQLTVICQPVFYRSTTPLDGLKMRAQVGATPLVPQWARCGRTHRRTRRPIHPRWLAASPVQVLPTCGACGVIHAPKDGTVAAACRSDDTCVSQPRLYRWIRSMCMRMCTRRSRSMRGRKRSRKGCSPVYPTGYEQDFAFTNEPRSCNGAGEGKCVSVEHGS
jgi:hypothetical protein